MAASAALLEETKVLVRCALQSNTDTAVVCPHDWTVLRLKEHLRDVYPGNPDTSRQRLIYAGQCLQDDRKLGTVFRRTSDPDTQQVIHLVCPPKDYAQMDKAADLRRRKNASRSQQQQQQQSTAATSGSASTGGGRGRQSGGDDGTGGQFSWPFAATPSPLPQPQAPLTPGDWNAAQQQMYQAYMANYMNYMNSFYNAMGVNGAGMATNAATASPYMGAFPTAFFPVTPPYTPPVVAQIPNVAAAVGNQGVGVADIVAPPVDGNANLIQGGPDVPAAGAANPAMNAQGGIIGDDDELREQDWLDWMYKAIRVGLLMTVIYFYSSAERLFGVCLLLFLAWVARRAVVVFRMGAVAAPNRQPDRPAEARPDVNQPVAPENPGNNPADTTPLLDGIGDQPDPAPAPVPAEPNPVTVFCQTCYTFVTTFFTSLIPENPPPLNAN